jgi:hypothetical protein
MQNLWCGILNIVAFLFLNANYVGVGDFKKNL